MNKQDRILITGSTGLVGSYILRYLINLGYSNIVALRRSTSNMLYVRDIDDKVEWITSDLLDGGFIYDHFEGIDYVFHCAALVTLDPAKVKEMFKSNVEGTANVVNACLTNNVKKLIFISSIAALGRNEEGRIIDEQVEWQESKLNSEYGKSKLFAEMEVWRGREEGLNVAIVNPSVVLGNGDWSRSSLKLFPQVSKGSSYFPIGGNGFVDVRDVAELTVKMAINPIVNERIILSGYNLPFKDIMELIAKYLGVNPPSKPLPLFMAAAIPFLDKIRALITFTSPIITPSTMRTVNHMSKYDNTKSIQLLKAKYRPIDTTIKDCSAAYLSQEFQPLPF